MDFHRDWRGDTERTQLICGLAAYAFRVTPEDVNATTRGSRQTALARQTAMYLAHVACGMSLARVAAAFSRDRSTVAHACHRIEDQRDDETFDVWIGQLEDSVRAAPIPIREAQA